MILKGGGAEGKTFDVLEAEIPQHSRYLSPLPSPLLSVSALAWERFAAALEVQPPRAISASGGFGAFDLRPRRLVELGYAQSAPPVRKGRRLIQVCTFLAPWTEQRFLRSTLAQVRALGLSMKLYQEDLTAGTLQRPANLSLAGALAILHRGGRGALAGWPMLFDDTRALYERAKGAF